MRDLDNILNKIEAEHPYKVPGDSSSYNQYNEGWCDCLDRVRLELKDVNDGWIPVEERLPEESGYYRVTVKNTELGDVAEETAWFAHVNDYDMGESEWRELYEYEEVIAWRELSPYSLEELERSEGE